MGSLFVNGKVSKKKVTVHWSQRLIGDFVSKGVSSSNAGMKKNKEGELDTEAGGEIMKKELIFQERNSTRKMNFLESGIITNKSFIDIVIPKENTR